MKRKQFLQLTYLSTIFIKRTKDPSENVFGNLAFIKEKGKGKKKY